MEFNWDLFLFENTISQKDLAKKIGYSTGTIYPLVRQKRITIGVKQAIEKSLGICLNEYLITKEGDCELQK